MNIGEQVVYRSEHGTEATIIAEDSTGYGEILYAIRIDGLVTWQELEALVRRLHPPGISAQEHARAVAGADTWVADSGGGAP